MINVSFQSFHNVSIQGKHTMSARTAMSLRPSIQNAQDANQRLPS